MNKFVKVNTGVVGNTGSQVIGMLEGNPNGTATHHPLQHRDIGKWDLIHHNKVCRFQEGPRKVTAEQLFKDDAGFAIGKIAPIGFIYPIFNQTKDQRTPLPDLAL